MRCLLPAVLALLFLFTQTAVAAAGTSTDVVPSTTRLLVRFDATTIVQRAAIIESAGAHVQRDIGPLATVVATVDAARLEASMESLRSAAHVMTVEVDRVAFLVDAQTDAEPATNAVIDPPSVTNGLLGGVLPAVIGTLPSVMGPDPLEPAQWGLRATRAAAAWRVTTASSNQLVAVVDSGVDYNHHDLAGKVVPGHDWVSDDGDPMDPLLNFSHGTHVAGVIAANTQNLLGMASVAPHARILAIRVMGTDNRGYHSDIASGIVEAVDSGAQVINLSIGGSATSTTLRDAIAYAAGRGVFLACAAGNDGALTVSYPAAYPGCFAVGASTPQDEPAVFSNRGAELALVAPGTSIISLSPGQLFAYADGTSMATPFVAGAAALLVSRGYTAPDIGQRLRAAAVDIAPAGWDAATGAGRLDIARAVGVDGMLPIPAGGWQSGASDSTDEGRGGGTPGRPGSESARPRPGLASVQLRLWLLASATKRSTCGTARLPCTIRRNRVIPFGGSATSARAYAGGAVRVRLERRVQGRWLIDRSTSVRVSRTGAFRLNIRVRRIGSWRVRAWTPANATHRASLVATRLLTVRG